MKRILVLILSAFVYFSASAQISGGDSVEGSYLVRVADDADIKAVIRSIKIRQPIEKDATIAPPPAPPDLTKSLTAKIPIWQVDFYDLGKLKPEEVLNQIRNTDGVVYAEYNRYLDLDDRTIVTPPVVPNDPLYTQQWQYSDPQDNDIDAPEAWEISTGGTTNDGYPIVIAVLEGGGSDYDHIDLLDNHWVNTGEIANNGIDDDGNGYIDDYHGWNTGTNGDNISSGEHGTGVSGMIGAVGNNGIGVAGINWDVQIMQIDMQSGLTNAKVIEAYEYARVMREMWNDSNGEEGAFVVATNASWGIDGGNADNYQAWCEFYDVLGEEGIINLGATANNPVNVDVVGDMPTNCTSDYMIGVTASNSSDALTFAGYGTTSIDLAAPGVNIYTTRNTSSYGSYSGTSFASPLTAGVIGLIYSSPCQDMGVLAYTDPQGTADQIIEYLLTGVDQVDNLATKTVTGGRLNAYNSLSFTCDETFIAGCMDPTACNYNANATVSSTCLFDDLCGVCGGSNECIGCTDPTSCSYDPQFTINDPDQCYYPVAGQACGDYDNVIETVSLVGGEIQTFTYQMNGYMDQITIDFSFTGASGAYASDLLIDITSPDGDCFSITGTWSSYSPSCSNSVVWPSNFNSSSSTTYGHTFNLTNPIGGTGEWEVQIRHGYASSTSASSWDFVIEPFNLRFQPDGAGCTDSTACNYDETAETDDGSCQYAQQYYDCNGVCLNDQDGDGICDENEVAGCTDGIACNYNSSATDDDGSCQYAAQYLTCAGNCINDEDGDGVCDELEIAGCQDQTACNYDSSATDDDGSCTYPAQYYDCNGDCINDVDTDGICDELETAGCTDQTACNWDIYTETDNTLCEYPQQYYDCDDNCLNDTDGDGVCDELEVSGCTDQSACNYDQNATDDDGSCVVPQQYYDCNGNCLNDQDGDGVCDELEVPGCSTDPTACNYNANATNEVTCTYPQQYYDCNGDCLNDSDGDGTCDELEASGCTDFGACNYDQNASEDDGSCEYPLFFRDCNGNPTLDNNANGIPDQLEGYGDFSTPCNGLPYVSYLGKLYNLVEIDGQCWFRNDVVARRYYNGDSVVNIADASEWQATTSGAYAFYNNQGLVCDLGGIAIGDSCCVIDTVYLDGDFTWSNIEIPYTTDSVLIYQPNTYDLDGKLNSGESYDTAFVSPFWLDRVNERALWDDNRFFPALDSEDHEGYTPGGICKNFEFTVIDNQLDHYMGIIADNYAIVILNGDTILSQSLINPATGEEADPFNYNKFNIYPIDVVNGTNTIQVEVINQNLYGAILLEVYEMTRNQLSVATQESDLNKLLDSYDKFGVSEFANDCVTDADRCSTGATYLPAEVACVLRDCYLGTLPGGVLYNWYAVDDPRGLCPAGWHVASDNDWKSLETYYGMPELELDKIGVRGNYPGVGDSLKASVSTVMNITYGGLRLDIGGDFIRRNSESYQWTSTPYRNTSRRDKDNAWYRMVSKNYKGVGRGWNFQQSSGGQGHGMYVRCVKD